MSKNRVDAAGKKSYNLPQIMQEVEMEFHSRKLSELSQDYQRIEQAIRYIEANYTRQPELSEIAAHLGLSEYHFQRLFSRWAGISPKRFLQFLTKEGAKRLLENSAGLLETTYTVGLSSPGRLHDLFVTTEAVTPGEFKARGKGLRIGYGFHPTPFGECLLAVTERGICHLGFILTSRADALAALQADWQDANLHEDETETALLIETIFAPPRQPGSPFRLFLRGTNFQIKAWEALLHIPPGHAATYQLIATAIGCSGASRAVGSALACNPLAFLIPCHRVIRKLGDFGNYRYGAARKKALLGWEYARTTAEAESSSWSYG
ncbi:MAG: methylated-DNA--[protein]-cysteine S-methyltransferase [Chloroflexota bacterium]